MSQFWKDALERIGWTTAQAAIGVTAVVVAEADLWWAAIIIPILTAAKVFAAKKVGNPETAAIGGNG